MQTRQSKVDSNLVKTSKFLSLVLRHRPEVIGLTLDAQGWADLDDLIARAAARGQTLSRDLIARVVAENDKQRFALSPDGTRIRANQGHSVAVDLALEPHEPPETLYHGTATRNLRSIERDGLRRGQRHHVHLSPDPATARAVGQRHGEPVVLRVAAAAMHRDGHRFYRAENGVWLTDAVPPAYLSRESDQAAPRRFAEQNDQR
jgi:putative RNA 2'-phosphotransferase